MKRRKLFFVFLIIYIFNIMPVSAKVSVEDTLADRRAMLHTPRFEIYSEQPSTGRYYAEAKFEPRSGTYHGTPYNAPFDGMENTVNTEYLWFDTSLTNDRCTRYEAPPAAHERINRLYAYNWNCAFKEVYRSPADYENYIKNTIDNIAANGMDNIVIFGKEFNIDDNFTHPENFIEFFRYIADYAHTKENIAMCWSPNDTGSLDLTLEEFYPGDEYVDWIGTSLYVFPYFQGDPKKTGLNASLGFIMGDYANPTMRAQIIFDFMERNGIVKPVFITEGAVGFGELPGRPLYKNGLEYLDWAKQQTRKYYSEMTRAFPLIKIMVCFNYVYPTDFYRYDMSAEPELSAYIRSTVLNSGKFIKKYGETAPVEYVPLHDTAFSRKLTLSAYAYEPCALYLTVRYKIDGNTVFSTPYPPYEYTLSEQNLSPGKHILTVEKLGAYDTVLDSKSYNIEFTGSGKYLYYTNTGVYLNTLRIPAYKYIDYDENKFFIKLSDLENYGWDVTAEADGALTVSRNYDKLYSIRDMSGYLAHGDGEIFSEPSDCGTHIVFENNGIKSVCTESFVCGGEILVNAAELLYVAYYENNEATQNRILITYS